MTESNKPLAWLLAGLTALYAIAFRVLPYETTAYLLWPFTALGLYAGARLKPWQSVLLMLGVQAGTDAILYLVHQWPASWGTYLTFGLFPLIGYGLLRTSHSSSRVFIGTTLAYTLFFFVSNTVAWGEAALPEYETKSLSTLMSAYRNGLEFLRYQPMQVFGQYVMAFSVFIAHDLLAKLWFPAEVVSTETVR